MALAPPEPPLDVTVVNPGPETLEEPPLDALAMACQYWVDAMAQDAEVRMGARKEELMVAELDRLKAAASMGLAVLTGHQGQKTNSLRW